jgi:GNAT superfamily N-acetyltransferase
MMDIQAKETKNTMQYADLALTHRLEATEAYSCAQFAQARKNLFPACSSEWTQIGGATVVFDGLESPATQTFGLGLFEPLTAEILEEIEGWFTARGAPIQHEVCPLGGVEALDLLCTRGYRPIEIASVLYQPLPGPLEPNHQHRVDLISLDQAELWSDISARGWSHEHPEFEQMLRDFGAITANRENNPCFLAYATENGENEPAAAGALSIHQGVALFIGAATLPEFRRRGLQSALLAERLRHAYAAGCDLAMMAAEAGGESQRNAERNGFRIAYTRIKWKRA